MARFLIGLSKRDLDKYKAQKLHVIPRASWNRLSLDEKRSAHSKGITAKGDDYQTHTGTPVDELPIAQQEAPKSQEGELAWSVIRQAIGMIIKARNARLAAECFRVCSGFGKFDGITKASIASKHGLAIGTISRVCTRLPKELGMKPSRLMCLKSPEGQSNGLDKRTIEEDRAWHALRLILDIILAAPNARLEAECFRLVAGFGGLKSPSQAAIARNYGIERAAVSKRCKKLAKLIKIRPSQFMRSMAQCETYRKARIRSLSQLSS
jgi:hypothetical protein